MSHKENLSLEEKELLAEAVCTYPCLYDKNKKEYKDSVCENAWGKVVEKLEFIENGECFQIFLSLCSSDIERNFLYIS